jgi:hypothetical protein
MNTMSSMTDFFSSLFIIALPPYFTTIVLPRNALIWGNARINSGEFVLFRMKSLYQFAPYSTTPPTTRLTIRAQHEMRLVALTNAAAVDCATNK